MIEAVESSIFPLNKNNDERSEGEGWLGTLTNKRAFHYPVDVWVRIFQYAYDTPFGLHKRRMATTHAHIRHWVKYYITPLYEMHSWGVQTVFIIGKQWYSGTRLYLWRLGTTYDGEQVFEYVSQLNGNNGSWTNTDDHPKGPYSQKRVRQVCGSAQVEKPVYLPRAVGKQRRAQVPPASPPTKDILVVDLPDTAHILPEPPVKEQVFSYEWFNIAGYSTACWFDGVELFNINLLPIGIRRELAGTVIGDVVEVGEGWVHIKPDGKDRVPRHMPRLLDTILSPALKINGVYFPAMEYTYFVPLYSRLSKDFPLKEPKPKILETLLAYANKYFNSVNLAAYVDITITAYVHMSYLRIHKLQQDHMVAAVANNLEIIAQLDNVYQSTIIREGLQGTSVLTNGAASRIDSVTYDQRDRYKQRKDYRITDRNDPPIFTEAHCIIDQVETIRPHFLIEDTSSAQFRTCFFDIRGDRQGEFLEYKNSLSNLAAGLSRMLKARPAEETFRANQAYLWANIGVLIDQKPLCHGGVCNDDYDAVTAVLNGRAYGSYDRAIPAEAWKFVAESILRDLDASMHYEYLIRFRDSMANVTSWGYNSILERMLTVGAMFSAREAAADINHVKRELRKSYVAGVKCHEPTDVLTRRMEANVKREVAKYGKAPRLFVSYGAGSMYANELPEFVKCCQHGMVTHHLNGKTLKIFTLAKPSETSMSELFRLLVSFTTVPNTMFVMIYGDDQVYIDCTEVDKPQFYNVDISSNDSNQDICVIGTNGLALAQFNREWACGLLKQLMLPIQFGPTRSDPRNHIPLTINFQGPFMGSGTVLTTSTNNWGSRLIALSTFHRRVMGQLPFEESVTQGAAMVGHSVTCERCGDIEQIQFLKISPVRTTSGEIIPMRNLGSILRNLGKCVNNLEHVQVGLDPTTFAKLSFSERMDLYTSVIISGYVNEPSSLVLDALRRRFPRNTNVSATTMVRSKDSELELKEDVRSHLVVDEESCARRYGCEVDDLRALAGMLEHTKLGDVIVSDVAARFFSVDYGVKNNP